jgi:outer membrane autotransporter protein
VNFNIVSVKNNLRCIAFAAFCLSLTYAHAQQAITTPILTTAPNFRDLAGISASNGGTGFVNPTNNNGVMRTGVFYRTSALNTNAPPPYVNLSNTDWTTISSLGIGRDIDLRMPTEYDSDLDWVPNGAIYTHIDITGNTPLPSTPQQYYQNFVIVPIERTGFGEVLTTLAHDTTPDLFHCVNGKDRTGWTAVLLQSIAGVSPDIIMQDYLASNKYLNDPTAVQASYLEAALVQVINSYGSMQAYLMQGLGLSQADIYVLRAKMVDYLVLPGQNKLTGNAASGAAFLNALQNSPLSGRYTAYNYYLQSAIDAGTLRGVETQVGGQVHADASSYLLRQGQWIDEAIMDYMSSRELRAGQSQIWLAGQGGNFTTKGYAGIAKSSECSVGSIIGITHRHNFKLGVNAGIGYDCGSVKSARATATTRTLLAILGGRYGFNTLDIGPYVEGRVDVGWVNYKSKRSLNEGLGTAKGKTNGAVYSGLAGLGHIMHLTPFTITPQVGVRVTGVTLGRFNENGSDLALNVNRMSNTYFSALLGLDIGFDSKQLCAWTIATIVTLGYEYLFGNPQVTSTGVLYDFTVSQKSAYNSRNLMKAGLGITARYNAFTIKAKGNIVGGNGDKSTGFNGLLSFGYDF